MPPELSSEALQWQLVLNFIAMTVIQWIKNSNWQSLSWVNTATPKLTKFISLIAAAATAQGIHGTFVHANAGTFTITLSGMTALAMAHVAKDIIQNYLGIKVMYRLMRPDDHVDMKPHPLPDIPPAAPALPKPGE